jgi:hypothetical protein
VPDSLAALAYDAAKVLADAIRRAGGTDSQKLKDAINQTKDFKGVTGTITLDASRNAIKPAVVLELNPSASKFAFKETIYPEGMSAPTDTTSNANTMMNTNQMSNSNMTNSNMTNSNMMNSNMMNSTSNMNSTMNANR